MKRICICGGGSLGHVIAGYLSAKKDTEVNILTRRPQLRKHELQISTPEGDTLYGKLNIVSDKPEETLHEVDIILLCLPGYAIKSELLKIKPYVNERTYVGTVFSSTGFFFEALEILDNDVPLWGFQRAPFIARTNVYAESLTRKIRSINGFKGITTPMISSEKEWQPDLNSRYFRKDFMHGLRYIHQEAHRLNIETPMIDKIYN